MASVFYVARAVHPNSRLDPRRSCAIPIRIRPLLVLVSSLALIAIAVGI